ncbi:transcription initiation factor TFIID subunit 11-like isoform X2 [Mytilus trossulus]|uniref:transcription initiation factor TFIID subunit 11-like isoform X2 n=1 Tax=Mytilus trossulus TaxID=6551 RepID=UPI0030076486
MAKANVKNNPKENGLQVLGENEDTFNFSNSASQKNPPVSSRSSSQASRRTPTPTKQISLTAVRRREESFHQEDDPSKVEELRKSMKLEAERSFVKEPTDLNEFVVERNTAGSHVTKTKKTSRHNCYHNGDVETAVQNEKKKPIPEMPKKPVDKATSNTTDKKKEESSSEESSDEEEEERKAPNQLLMEFLECIYAKDFPTAAKLCKMILIFEPDHPVALQFQPVIEEKIQQDIEAEQEGEGSDESGSDEEDSGEEDDSDSDDDDSDSDDSDDSDDDDDDKNDDGDNENEDNQKIPQPQQKPSLGPFKV